MKKSNLSLKSKTISFTLFYSALAINTIVLSILVWGFIEAMVMFSMVPSDSNLKSFDCPFFMNSDVKLQLDAPVSNSLDKSIRVASIIEVTTGFSTTTTTERIRVDVLPNTTESVQWIISPDNRVFGRMVLIRVVQYNNADYIIRSSFCPVLVTDLFGLSGHQIWQLAIIASAVSSGLALSYSYFTFGRQKGQLSKHNKIFIEMLLALGLLLIGVVFAIRTHWIPGFFILIFIIFLATAMFQEYIKEERIEAEFSRRNN